jgi:hypothetical protein
LLQRYAKIRPLSSKQNRVLTYCQLYAGLNYLIIKLISLILTLWDFGSK